MVTESPTWPAVIDAAVWLGGELGVSPSPWAKACQIMGREMAAIAVAIVSTKDTGHFTRSAGGYFAGMVQKAERGELHLDRSLWALRGAHFGRPPRRTVN